MKISYNAKKNTASLYDYCITNTKKECIIDIISKNNGITTDELRDILHVTHNKVISKKNIEKYIIEINREHNMVLYGNLIRYRNTKWYRVSQ